MTGPIDRWLEGRRLNGLQYGIIAVVLVTLVIDGLDVQLLSLVAPLVLKDWGIGRQDFGPAMSAALLGSCLGSSVGGALGDRFGRRTVFVLATLLFGAGTALAGYSDSVRDMTALRLVGGFGFGAALPASVALVSEWLPQRLRPRIVGMTSIGTPLGGMLGAACLAGLLPWLGWRGCFLLCGAVSVLFGLAAWVALPESPAFLVARGHAARATTLLSRVLGGSVALPEPVPEPLPETSAPAAGGATGAERIFDRGNLRLNAGSWLAFFGVYFVAYGTAAWLPVMLTGAGLDLPTALHASFLYNLCSVVSGLVHGLMVTRFGSRRLLLSGAALTLLCVLLLATGLNDLRAGGAAGEVGLLVFAGVGGLGAFNGALIAVVYVVLAQGFPPACRAGGVGIAMMVGRAGGIVSSFFGGLLLSVAGAHEGPFLSALAVAAVLVLTGTLVIDRHVSPAG